MIRTVPIDIIFFGSAELNGELDPEQYLPLILHRPLVDLFRYVIHGEASPNSYFSWRAAKYGGVDLDRERCLSQERWRARKLRWFGLGEIPAASGLSEDRLLLSSGLTQACLAKVCGRSWISLSMPDQACAFWDARSVRDLDESIRRSGRKMFYNPVLHAQYRMAKVERREPDRLDRIRRLLGTYCPGLKGIDIGCNMGYMCHMLRRQGMRMTGVDFDQNHLAVARSLNITYGLDVSFIECRFEEYESSELYDIALMLTVFYHSLNKDRQIAKRILENISLLTRSALVWESGEHPEREIEFIRGNSDFTEYLNLGPTRGTGKHRELGVFLRAGDSLAMRLAARYRSEFANEFLEKGGSSNK